MSMIDIETPASLETDAKAQAIREKSEEVRGSLAGRVADLKVRVDELFDWSHYVREHPWVVASLAGAVGYALAPRLRGRPEDNGKSPRSPAPPIRATPTTPPPSVSVHPANNDSVQIGDVLGEIALQAAMTFVAQQAVRYMTGFLAPSPTTAGSDDHERQ